MTSTRLPHQRVQSLLGRAPGLALTALHRLRGRTTWCGVGAGIWLISGIPWPLQAGQMKAKVGSTHAGMLLADNLQLEVPRMYMCASGNAS